MSDPGLMSNEEFSRKRWLSMADVALLERGKELPPWEYVAPVLCSPVCPPQAMTVAREWQRGSRHSVATVRLEMDPSGCDSCGGEGKVYLRLLRDGPFKNPGAGTTLFLDATPTVTAGYWVLERTDVYWCPKCQGSGRS